METSTTNQPGGKDSGTAAEPPNINPKPNTNNIMTHTNDKHITLKLAATHFGCSAISLKNNIKSGKLTAAQADKKSPYMVLLSEVESFLRETPKIASDLHPSVAKAVVATTGEEPESGGARPAKTEMTLDSKSSVTEPSVAQPNHAQPSVVEHSAEAGMGALEHSQSPQASDPQPEQPGHVAANRTKKRRRRKRGKGGGNESAAPSLRQPVLKALAGTTPQERLRITACLTELVGLVASA